MPDESKVINIDELLQRIRTAEEHKHFPAAEFTREEMRSLMCFFHFTGLRAGVEKYAWLKGGVEFVGMNLAFTKTLEVALSDLEDEVKKEMGVFYVRAGD